MNAKRDEFVPNPSAGWWPWRWLARAALVLLGIAALPAHAVSTKVYCIGDSFQLGDVLVNGNETASVNLDIRLRQGTYTITSTKATFIAPTTIRGGWSDQNCTVRTANPNNTQIDLSGGYLVIKQPKGLSRANLTIDGVTFKHGDYISLASGTTNELDNDDGDMTIRRTRFTNFSGVTDVFATVDFFVATGSGRLENVLIDHIGAPNFPQCTVGLDTDGADANWGVNYLTGDFGGSVCLTTGPTYYVTNVYNITNSIFWNSIGGPPNVITLLSNGSATVYVYIRTTLLHEYYDYESNKQPFFEQLDADPKWIAPQNGTYDLGPSSPAIDFGYAQSNLGLPSNDMVGQARLIGPNPDLGALESNGSTIATYLVTNTNDSGAGSLRQAITDANASADPGEIDFQLPGACPQTIQLQSVLPKITSYVRVNGYSQAGSYPNNDPVAFNGNICVLIKAASNELGYAFSVPANAPAAALDLSGVGLGGFAQPVIILGGSVHRVAGIQIGGNIGGVPLLPPSLNGISNGMGTLGAFRIGGATLGERNVILGTGTSTARGVNIQSTVQSTPDKCLVQNNLIGLTATGLTSLPFETGINLAGSGCAVLDNRIAGSTSDAIWINGGNNNIVQRNVLGLDVNGAPIPIFNDGYGIRITGQNNVIGSPYLAGTLSGTVNANTISNNLKGGVGVIGASATGNAIRGNLIYGNIVATAPAIDLGGDGSTANDGPAKDADVGPNQLENFPLVTSLEYKSAPPAGATNFPLYLFSSFDGAPGTYRADVYFYNGSCSAGQRGQAQKYLGGYTFFSYAGYTATFNVLVTLPNVAADAAVSITAVDSAGNTSELSPCFKVSDATLINGLFKDSFE